MTSYTYTQMPRAENIGKVRNGISKENSLWKCAAEVSDLNSGNSDSENYVTVSAIIIT